MSGLVVGEVAGEAPVQLVAHCDSGDHVPARPSATLGHRHGGLANRGEGVDPGTGFFEVGM